MPHNANIVLILVMSHILKSKQALAAGTKQSKQAGRQGSLLCLGLECFVLYTLIAPLVFLQWMFYKPICLEQSTSLRYLCPIPLQASNAVSWCLSKNHPPNEGTLTEGEDSVQLTSSLRYLIFYKKVNNIFIFIRNWSKIVSTRRSTVQSLPFK